MWLKLAKNIIIHIAQNLSIPSCTHCGGQLTKSNYGNDYYCRRCYAGGHLVKYNPDNRQALVRERDSKKLIYEGPWDLWEGGGGQQSVPVAPSSRETSSTTPKCKIDGSDFTPSKHNVGQLYCPVCWRKGIVTEYTPSIDKLSVKRKYGSQIYLGNYSEWKGTEISGPTSIETSPEQGQTEPPEDITEINIEKAVTASGDYANGQPEGDLIQGNIRIFSEEHKSEIPIDTESILTGINKISSKIENGLDFYVENQHFLYLSQLGDPRYKDIRNSPIILDSVHDNESKFINSVVNNPLYRYTGIGAEGHTPNISQANAIDVIANTDKNLILCFPTGAGKTACAEAAIAKGLRHGKTEETRGQIAIQNPIAIYVCPARALAAQIAKDFSAPEHPFAKSGWGVRIERGVRQIDNAKEEIDPDNEETDTPAADDRELQNLAQTDNASIIVATPERLLSCLMNPRIHTWVNRISTMVFDEGHLLGDESRGAKFEGEQIHLYRDYYQRIKTTPIGKQCSIIFMSATMQNALELSAWQSNTTQDPNWSVVWGEYKPVKIEQEFKDYEISQEEGQSEEDLVINILDDIISEENYCTKLGPESSTSRVMRPTLVFFHVKRRAYAMQRIAKKNFRECQNQNCGYVFRASTSGDRPTPAASQRCPVCNSAVSEWEIDFHHAGESSGNQQKYVSAFNSGTRNVLLATSTLAAGVNTGAMSVYIGGCARGPNDVSSSDIGQMRGRAGRQSFAHMYPDQPARVVIYTEKDRSTHHRRRIQAGSYLESMMVDPIYIVDNILRAVRMGSIRNFKDAGDYIASSLAYFQSRVDNRHRMNVRQSLKEISTSIGGSNNDRVEWITITDPSCQHGNLKIDEQSTENDDGTFDWHMICKDCGSEGLMEQEFRPLNDEDFLRMVDSALRDLIGAGFLVILPDGTIQITSLGKDIVRSHMESATAVDIVRNMIGFDPATASAMDVAVSLGNVRANNDERRGCYISLEQAAECEEVLTTMGLDAKSAFPAVKNIQCLLWSLRGITIDQIPDCLKSDFMSIPDNYGGPFLNGFGALAQHAGWFKNAGDMLSQIQVQLRKQVSPSQTPFAVVHMIGAATASALENAGFTDMRDVMASSETDTRWADFCFYHWRWHLKAGKTLPSDNPYQINDWWRDKMSRESKRIKNMARMAFQGQKPGKNQIDSEYKRMVELLNSTQFLQRIRDI